MRIHLRQPGEGAGRPGAQNLAQYQAWPDHAAQYLLESRRARRLQEGVLEICTAPAAAGRYRGPDWFGHDRAPSDYIRASGLGWSAERVELFNQAARGLGPRRVMPT